VQNLLARFVKDESAATAIEYAVLVGSISVIVIAAVNRLGHALSSTFATVSGALGHRDFSVIVDDPSEQ
jgi:pilus assembly protein Flp/PilA